MNTLQRFVFRPVEFNDEPGRTLPEINAVIREANKILASVHPD